MVFLYEIFTFYNLNCLISSCKDRASSLKAFATSLISFKLAVCSSIDASDCSEVNFARWAISETAAATSCVPAVSSSKEGSELLFQLISDWYEQKSIIITSNLEFSQWNRVFMDSRLTAALVDRVNHHAHILSFTGDSYRVTHALSR